MCPERQVLISVHSNELILLFMFSSETLLVSTITEVDLFWGAFVAELAGFPPRVVAEARRQAEDLRHERIAEDCLNIEAIWF